MKTTTSHLTIVMGGQFAQIGIGVVTSMFIARGLGAEGYALVNLVRNGFLLALTATPLGLDASLLKYLANGQIVDPTKRIVASRLMTLSVAVATGVWALICVAAAMGLIHSLYHFTGIDALACVTFLALPFATYTVLLSTSYRSTGRVARYALLVPYAQSAFRIVAIPLALWLAPTAMVVVGINTLQIMLSAALIWVDGRSMAGPPSRVGAVSARTVDADFARVIREAGWMCLSIVVYSLMRSVDLLFLGVYAEAKQIGAYAALGLVAQLITILPLAASQTLGPRVASAHESRAPGAVKRELDSYLRLTAPASAFLFGGIAAFGPRLDLIFGAGFVFDPVVCFLLPLGQVLSATLGPLGYSLSMTGRHRAENAILVAGGALLVIGCALLVPPFGARGAAAVVAAAFFFVNVWRFAVVRKMIGAWPGAWRDFAAAPIALTLACLCAAAASRWGARDLATTALACSIYTVAFAAAAFGLSSVVARRVVGAGLLSATQRLWHRPHEGRR